MTLQEQLERVAVTEEAKKWLGTPYHNRACLRGVGCDCAMLPLEVYRMVGLVTGSAPFYSSQWHMNRNQELYVEYILQKGAREIEESEVRQGDLVLYKVFRTYGHSGIVLKWPNLIIHAIEKVGVVYSHGSNDGLLVRLPHRFFTLW